MPVSAQTATGLRGLVTKGPITPVCQVDVACDVPAAGVKLTFTRGEYTKSVTTGDDGRYRVLLPAGVYAVRVVPARFGFAPRSATVLAGRVRIRNFSIDTGIR